MATQITSITFNEGIMTVVFANGQQDDWNLAYVVGPVSTYSVPEPTLPDGEEHRVRSGFEVATARFVYPDEAEPRIFSADVRDVASPTYATAQDLADDITENIPTGGGGGGGGETEPAGSNTQVQFNDNGEFGASADLVFDGPILTVGGNTGDGVLELGDASGSGEVAANILNLEASVDVTASAGNKVALTTGGQERLAVDANGALLLATEPGEAGQIPVSAGPGAPVAWRDLLASGVGMSTFFFATVNGVRSLYIEVFQGVDPPPNRYWSVNGVESVDNAIFGASGAWVVNEAGNTVGSSTDAVASPTLATTWTGSATVVVEPVLYGPTVQDALEQLAAEVSSPSMYRALLTQSSTDAPSLTVLLNELGGSPVASYVSPGVYRITLSGAFDPDKTLAMISNSYGDGATISIVSARVDASGNYIEIVTGTGQDDIDEILNKTPLLIEVYP